MYIYTYHRIITITYYDDKMLKFNILIILTAVEYDTGKHNKKYYSIISIILMLILVY